jgi:hypothetical protein
MGWVHRNRRHGALFALAALVLQIAVSFGHVHVQDLHLDGIVRAAPHAAIAGAHNVTLAQNAPQAPTQNPGDADDYCAICASIFLVSTSFASEPPKLPVPMGFERVRLSFAVARDIITSRRFAFQSRAPPAV